MEGSTVESRKDEEVIMEFHSHYSDQSDQNYASTHAQMCVLFDYLKEKDILKRRKTTVWYFTEGCAKKYRFLSVVLLLSQLAAKYNITVDRKFDAPGHGKGNVDGCNAVDKMFLKKMMCFTCKPGQQSSKNTMAAETMSEGREKSFADECSNPDPFSGVKSEGKYAKRESNAMVKKGITICKNMRKMKCVFF